MRDLKGLAAVGMAAELEVVDEGSGITVVHGIITSSAASKQSAVTVVIGVA